MVFDMCAGLSDEYRAYGVIQPEQLPFRQPADESESMAAASFSNTSDSNAKTLIIIGAVMIVLGILILFQSLGGIGLILFGLLPLGFGIAMRGKGKAPKRVATGVLLKKDSYETGTIHNHTRTHYNWLVISVDGMEKTLCTVRANDNDYNEAQVGDRIVVFKDAAAYRGKPIR